MSATDAVTIDSDLIRRISRSEYREMGRAGLFGNERVELLYGQLVIMTPPDPSHDESIWVVSERLRDLLHGRARVRVQSSFAASDESEPLPDIVVVPDRTYWDEHPQRALLVIEVSRTSIRKDRGVKARLYGEVAVDEYWIVDVDAGCVHVLRDSDAAGRWRSQTVHHRGESLSPLAFPDVSIAVAEILPPG